MSDINWNRLSRAIKNEGSVLFIGPDIEKDELGKPVLQELCKKIVNTYPGEITYDEKEGFLFFIEPEAKNDVIYDFKEYYEKHNFAQDVYALVAAIPFHLVISLTPDDSIHHAFVENGVAHDFVYFDSNKAEIEKPTKDKPLIYSLFGLSTEGKYILSQEDYFNYIKAVLSDDILPTKMISALRAASNYIFVGFDFEKWYVRLLLMILNFHKDKESKTRHAVNSSDTESLYKELTEKQFNINFIKDKETDFFQSFYNKMKEDELLRDLKPKPERIKSELLEKEKLLSEYEELVNLSSDPKEVMRSEKAIELLKKEMEDLQNQLQNL
jgi:hypothetical protein